MSHADKSRIYGSLKAAGYEFEKHYRDYSTADLNEIFVSLEQSDPEQYAAARVHEANVALPSQEPPLPAPPAPMLSRRPENELPGERLNSKGDDEILFVDDEGRSWLQVEVRKPAAPRPRGRRVLKYIETGTKVEEVRNGDFLETFEVAGRGVGRSSEIKITLPSYQVGIYRDRRYPFKVHVYNEVRGFDLFEVEDFYGGADLVPMECKRKYVQNVLCYDIRTVVRAIETEYRQQQLAAGKA